MQFPTRIVQYQDGLPDLVVASRRYAPIRPSMSSDGNVRTNATVVKSEKTADGVLVHRRDSQFRVIEMKDYSRRGRHSRARPAMASEGWGEEEGSRASDKFWLRHHPFDHPRYRAYARRGAIVTNEANRSYFERAALNMDSARSIGEVEKEAVSNHGLTWC